MVVVVVVAAGGGGGGGGFGGKHPDLVVMGFLKGSRKHGPPHY